MSCCFVLRNAHQASSPTCYSYLVRSLLKDHVFGKETSVAVFTNKSARLLIIESKKNNNKTK